MAQLNRERYVTHRSRFSFSPAQVTGAFAIPVTRSGALPRMARAPRFVSPAVALAGRPPRSSSEIFDLTESEEKAKFDP